MSFEHYIHCMDWLLPAFLHRSSLLGGQKPSDLIEVGAVPTSTAYDWTGAGKLRGGFSEFDRLQGISAELYRRRFPKRARLCASKPESGASQDLSQTNEPTIADYWELLYLRGISNEQLCDLVERFGIDLSLAEAAIDRTQRIREIREERGGKVKRHQMEQWEADRRRLDSIREIDCPRRPRTVDLAQIRKLESCLRTAIGKAPDEIRRTLSYYVHNVWATETILPFRDPDDPRDAQRYVRFLEAMGFSRKAGAIRYTLFDPCADSPERKKWIKHLRLNRDRAQRFIHRHPPFHESPASKRWAAIEPDLGGDDAAGFRFFMVMAAIVYGFE
jgi:hypothetical protein